MGKDSQPPLEALAGVLWDLRDHSYDHPDQWKGVEAVEIFRALALIIDRALDADEDIDWAGFPHLVRETIDRGRPTA